MSYKRNCSKCKYSTFGSYDPNSDFCDDCIDDPDVGSGGFTDHSFSDEEGNSPHFYSDKEQREFWERQSEKE